MRDLLFCLRLKIKIDPPQMTEAFDSALAPVVQVLRAGANRRQTVANARSILQACIL